MTVKFHEKNVALFGLFQPTEGTPVNPAATNAIAVTVLEAPVTRENEAFQYLGDALDRDELTTLKDTFGEITAESFMPVLGAINLSLPLDDAPYSHWFQACGGFITVDGGTGKVTVDNATASDDLITIDFYKSSPEATGNLDKRYRFQDCRGTVDLSFDAGSRAKLNFKFLGNDAAPTMETALVADFGSQKDNIAPVVRKVNMQTATIQEKLGTEGAKPLSNIVGDATTVTVDFAAAHGLVTGDEVSVTATTNYNTTLKIITVVTSTQITYLDTPSDPFETTGDVTRTAHVIKTMCVNSFNAANFFGFDYQRFLLTCQEGFTKGATPTDVSVVMLEDEVGGTDFDPEANIEKFFEVIIKYGTGAGKFVTIQMDRLQVSDVKDAKVASYQGKDVTFRNIGNSFLIFE